MRRWVLAGLLLLALAVLHFHDRSNFTRPLLDFDDKELIGPLDGMSLSTYFGEWAAQSDHFLFPLRDLTYVLDFKLSSWLGFQTFWLVNFVIFLLTLALIARIFAVYYRGRFRLVAGCVALIALHPINVHMVEWLSNRKHLLVLLILGWATWKALTQAANHVAPSARDWAAYLGAYTAAWLCYPTGALWIFWLLFVFLPHLRQNRGRAWVLLILALAIAGAGYHLTVDANTSFQAKAGVQTLPLRFSLESSGRAFFNLLFPIHLQPYYRPNDSRAWVGLGLLAIAMGLACHRLYRLPSERRRACFHLFALALAFYVPNAKVFLGYSEFVWSDRYLYLSLPFLVLAVLLLLVDPDSAEAPAAGKHAKLCRHWMGLTALIAIAGTYFVLDWQLVPRWQDGRQLFETCSKEEESPKCVAMAVEKNFDQGGCATLPEMFDLARRIAPRTHNIADHSFQAETPVYEALCIAAQIASPQEKLREIEALRSVYAMTDFLMLGRILVHLQSRDLSQALATANATYFNPSLPMPNTSTKIINMMRGQGEALCVLSDLIAHDKACWGALERFRARVANVVVKPKQTTWTFNRTLAAFNTGQ